ncbi:MAG: hypothetical protein VX484_04645 [Chloroflexota bacterium]|nr:hypothetical protein [Chloroflexota bacterium]
MEDFSVFRIERYFFKSPVVRRQSVMYNSINKLDAVDFTFVVAGVQLDETSSNAGDLQFSAEANIARTIGALPKWR